MAALPPLPPVQGLPASFPKAPSPELQWSDWHDLTQQAGKSYAWELTRLPVEMTANFLDKACEIVGLVRPNSDGHAEAQRALVRQPPKLGGQVWRPGPVIVRGMSVTRLEALFGDFGRAEAMDFDQRR
jgi:hypothetical protein